LFSEADDVVLDCFMGSGTTAIAAITEGRKYIGIDKEKKSVQIALEAISSFKADRKGPEQVELFIREIEAKHEKNND
jgi:site-specific DNA-methyltransferase (adenine-specific)